MLYDCRHVNFRSVTIRSFLILIVHILMWMFRIEPKIEKPINNIVNNATPLTWSDNFLTEFVETR